MRKRNICISAMLAGFLCLFTAPVYAAGAVDTSKKCSLTLDYEFADQPISDAKVDIYQIADLQVDGSFEYTEEFQNVPVVINNLQSDTQWLEAAETLSGIVSDQKIASQYLSTSNTDGIAKFGNLSAGLYLAVTEPIVTDTDRYVFEPYLISCPDLNDQDVWQYDVTSLPKDSHETFTKKQLEYRVVKHWDDDGYTNERLVSITVDLLKDSELYDEVVLNSDNDWSYSWKAADDGSTWQAVEKSTDTKYTVTSVQNSNLFTLTNTYKPTTPTPTPKSSKELPHTGLMNWPIPCLAILGLAAVIAGYIIYKHGKVHE